MQSYYVCKCTVQFVSVIVHNNIIINSIIHFTSIGVSS